MAHKKIKCSMCDRIVKMEHRLFYQCLTNYRVNNIQELNTVYKCRECKCSMNRTSRLPINEIPRYLRILGDLRALVKEFETRVPYDPNALINFKKNVDSLFLKENITPNNYQVLGANNRITGFLATNIPIVGNIIFPLKEGKNK